jgi:hypothetical protein
MKKINYLVIGLFMTILSCGKDNVQPTTTTTPIVTPIGSTKKDCEINHQGTLKVVNISFSDFYIYIEDIYVVTSKAGTISTYSKVPSHSGLTVKAINISNNSDLRTVDMPFYDCMTTEIDIK